MEVIAERISETWLNSRASFSKEFDMWKIENESEIEISQRTMRNV